MNNEAMMNRAKQLVVDYFNSHVDVTDGKKLTMATRTRPIWMSTRSGTTSVSRTKEQLWTVFSLL